MVTITLVVPEGVDEGDSLSFIVDGQELEISLPEGTKVGDTLQLQVAGDDNNDDVDEAATTTNTSSRSTVTSSSNEAGIYKVPLNSELGKAELTLWTTLCAVENSTGSDATIHSEPWPTGLLMADVITHPKLSESIILASCGNQKQHTDTNIRVLELGSGLGTVGLALAYVLSNGINSKKAEVILTDYQSAIPLLKANIASNQNVIKNNVAMTADPLEWGKHDAKDDTFDIIVGSDLLYDSESSYRPLVETISTLLSKPTGQNSRGGIILLGTRWRKPDKERKFFAIAETYGIDFILLEDWLKEAASLDDESILNTMRAYSMPTLPWRRYGDVEDDEFMQYLSTVFVSTGGDNRTVSLMELTESDIELMDDNEHASFEGTQIQIYVGMWRGEKKAGMKKAKLK